MAFNLPETYQRLAGTLHVGERDLTTGGLLTTSGLTFIGDASELTLDLSQESVEHREHQSGFGKNDAKVPRTTDFAGNLILDNTGVQAFRLFLQSKATVVAGGTVTAEAITAPTPAAGKSVILAKPVATFTSLTDADIGGVTPFTAGTDYIREGRVIYFPTGTTITGGESLQANYTAAASTNLDLMGEIYKDYYVFFNGINTVTRKAVNLELFKVNFDAGTLGNLLGDEIVQLTMPFKALYEPLKSTSNLGGYGTYTLVD